jgi:hypothetical protein
VGVIKPEVLIHSCCTTLPPDPDSSSYQVWLGQHTLDKKSNDVK